MFRPNLYKNRVTDITVNELKSLNVNSLFLDVDNTLSTHHGKEYVEGLDNWINYMKENGISLILTSNSKEQRVEPFAKGIDLDYVSMSLKPLWRGFKIALKRLGVKRNNVCVVGDQIFTDVLGAKLFGLKVILLKPILPEDKPSFKIRRFLEKIIIKIGRIEVQ